MNQVTVVFKKVEENNMNGSDQIIGIVGNGQFVRLPPSSNGPVRLTSISMQMPPPPETAELDLTDYEGKAIMVEGHDGGDWIYSAQVIDQAGPILTMLVQQVIGQAA